MAIEGIASPSAGIAQFQARPPQSTQSSGTDNGAVRDFLQAGQQPANQTVSSPSETPPVQTQTAAAVQQTNPGQASARPQQPAANDGGSIVAGFTQQLEQLNDRGEPTPQPPTSQNSALNYNAGGSANAAQNANQAGRVVSLSV